MAWMVDRQRDRARSTQCGRPQNDRVKQTDSAKRDTTQEVYHVTTDPLQGQSNCQPDEIEVEDREVHGRSKRLVDSEEAAAIDEEMMKEDISAESIYYHEGCELFAKMWSSIWLCHRR